MDPAVPLFAYLILVVLALVLIVAWIVLPFAIIGTKALLGKILAGQERVIQGQQEIIRLMGSQVPSRETHVRCPYCREPVWAQATKCPNCASSITPNRPASSPSKM